MKEEKLRARWKRLDARIQAWWDEDLHSAGEDDVRNDPMGTLLFLPHPYSSAAGKNAAFPEMYCWDTYFINLGLLKHGRLDIVRHHILNQLFQVERYGFVPNGNRSFYLTRSQPPMLGDSVHCYLEASNDLELAERAYQPLITEYDTFWNTAPRRTTTGLATNSDSGDPNRRPELAAEAETGRDFTAIYGGDVRRCVPLHINSALVRYAEGIADVARRLGRPADCEYWKQCAEERARKMRSLCWSEQWSSYVQYDWTTQTQLPYLSLCAFWVMWAGVATPDQARQLVGGLDRFLRPHGLSFTDQVYASPHPEYDWLQWGAPSGWPPEQMIVVEALDRYGFHQQAREVAIRYLAAQLSLYDQTGQLWEKLNVNTGDTELPHERYEVPPFHGWSSASIAVLGARVFGPE